MDFFLWKEYNEWNEKKESFTLASARCRKDSTEVIINTYEPRLNEKMKRIKEAGCVSIFDVIPKDENDKQEEYMRIGNVETKRFETDEVIRVGVPVETWMASDMLLFAIALGKEGSASHWCTYCETSKALWKKERNIEEHP